MGSILLARELPEEGGDTLFANMYRAYETLSEPIKRLLTGLTALHDSSKAHYYRVKAKDRENLAFPSAEHPVVRIEGYCGMMLGAARKGCDVEGILSRQFLPSKEKGTQREYG